MEEGPEPQEWVEKAVEHQHESGRGEGRGEGRGHGAGNFAPALTAAILAVLAALGSLLSGHEANEALVLQTKATDQWSFYQAKSTKEHLYEVSRQVVEAFAETQAAERTPRTVKALDQFQKNAGRYADEKEEIKRKAEELEVESAHHFHRHHRFATAIALFQVSIVLASITILVRRRALLLASQAGGLAGLIFVILGMVS